jgi:ubiquinone/menaquinone biosynthesis C-methylase UbiE
MRKHYLDYNPISSTYNKRYKVSKLPGVEIALEELFNKFSGKNILEVGCGTGYWLNKFHSPKYNLFGLDISTGMLREAQNYSTEFFLICSDAGFLPFLLNSFDMIFIVNALHFLNKKNKFIYDAYKLLRSNGTLIIINYDPRTNDNTWYLYDYFKNRYKFDLERYTLFETVEKWLNNSGFRNISLRNIDKVYTKYLGKEVLEDPFLEKNQTSQLASLSKSEYNAGFELLKKDVLSAEQKNEQIKFITRLTFKMITAQK